MACLMWAPSANAWWESTLQQVDVTVTVTPSGQGRVNYELRYHVDRGRFEGLTINDPGRALEWDRTACYIEDAGGRRYPAKVMRRHRDGAYLVRIARPPGLRRGFVTVSLTHIEDLHAESLRTDDDGRTHLDWTALSWELGMDRMTVMVRLDPVDGELTPDERSDRSHDVEQSEAGLYFNRVRPVRWYEMRVGAYLPQGYLERAATRATAAEPDVIEAEAAPIPPPPGGGNGAGGMGALGGLSLVLLALVSLVALALKWRAGAAGYRGRDGAAEPLLLPRVPLVARAFVVTACIAVGVWLQSVPYLAAGTLAFAAGILLAVRGGGRRDERPLARAWWPCTREVLDDVVDEDRRRDGRRSWPRLLDGTSWTGVPVLALAGFGAVTLLQALWAESDTALWDAIAVDLVLVLAATLLTGRRRDVRPSAGAGSALVLRRGWKVLHRAAQAAGSDVRVLVGAASTEGNATDVRLAFVPPPPGTLRVEVAVMPVEGTFGWLARPVAEVRRVDGTVVSLRARGGRGLARRLRRFLARAAANPAE